MYTYIYMYVYIYDVIWLYMPQQIGILNHESVWLKMTHPGKETVWMFVQRFPRDLHGRI